MRSGEIVKKLNTILPTGMHGQHVRCSRFDGNYTFFIIGRYFGAKYGPKAHPQSHKNYWQRF